MFSQSTTVRTWVFMGMAMFYVLFLLTVMKFFEASGPELLANITTKPVESIVVHDRDMLADLKPVAERQMSSHVVRVSHSPHNPSQDLDYGTLLRREFDKDDSKVNLIEDIRASGFCNGNDNDNMISSACGRLFPTNIRPRLREPMLKRNGVVVRSLLGFARMAIGSNRSINHRGSSGKRRTQLSDTNTQHYIVSTEWGTSKVR